MRIFHAADTGMNLRRKKKTLFISKRKKSNTFLTNGINSIVALLLVVVSLFS